MSALHHREGNFTMESLHDSTAKESRPDIGELFQVFKGPVDGRSVALTRIFLVSVLYTLYFAREVRLSIVLA